MANSQEFTLTKPGDQIAQQLGFVAKSVVVDNLTSSFVRVSGASRDVPPWMWGVVVPITGSQVAQASLIGVTPAVPTLPVPSAVATLTFSDQDVSATSGYALQQYMTAGEQAASGSPFTVTRNGILQVLGQFTIPAGSQDLLIATPVAADIATFQVIGLQSGIHYDAGSFNIVRQRNYVRLHPTLDTSVQVQVVPVNVGGTASVNLVFMFSNYLVATDQGTAEPVSIVNIQNNPIGSRLGRDGLPGLSVSLEQSIAPPWEQANILGPFATGSVAAGASVTLIAAGAAGVHTLLKEAVGAIQAAAGSTLSIECPAGTIRTVIDGTFTHQFEFDFDWFDCGAVSAVVAHNTTANATGAVNMLATANQT